MLKHVTKAFTTSILLCASLASIASEDPEQLFKQCQACHLVGPGAKHQFGPHLNGLADRPAGALDDYAYSNEFSVVSAEGGAWNQESLDAFLLAPMDVVKGTKMAFLGVKDDDQRAALVDWLLKIDSDGSKPEVVKPVATEQVTKQELPRVAAADVPIPKHGVLHIGRAALEEEVAAWNIDIRPDGQGLPDGQGSVETGGELYDAQCAACHGVFGEGEGRWPILAGGEDTLTDDRPEKTIGSYWPYLSTVFDYVKRAMPFGNARSLSDDDVYALTAYLLYLNDQVEEEFTLSSENFASIAMPNEQNFIDDNRADEAHYATADEPCMSNCIEGNAQVTQRARVLDVTPETEGEGVSSD